MVQNAEKTDLIGGLVLGAATLAAVVIANSTLEPHYSALIHATAEIRVGSLGWQRAFSIGSMTAIATALITR